MAGAALAQAKDKDPVSVTVTASPATVRRGEAFRLDVRFDIEAPYHIYGPQEAQGAPTKVEPEPEPGLAFGPPEFPPPVRKTLPELGGTFALYEKQATVSIPVTVAADAEPRQRALSVKVSYGACTDATCLRPVRRRPIPGQIVISDAPPAAGPPAVTGTTTNAAPPPAAGGSVLGGTLLEFLWACVLGGLITLLMPCVYPLIPITMTYFIKQSEGSRSHSAALAGMYTLGLIASFTGLGLGLSLLFGAGGAVRFAAHPWVNLAVAGVFLVFALSMFGLFDISLPGSWTSAVMSGPRQGLGGAFVLGAGFSVITFTCTMPVASALLALAAGASPSLAVLGMLVYSSTMAVPFFVLGMSPGLLKTVPRSGSWLTTAKVGMGFLEIVLVVYYLSKSDYGWRWRVLTREAVLGLWLSITACAAAYFFGWFRLRGHETEGRVGYGRVAAALAATALAGFFVAGLSGRRLSDDVEALLPRSGRDEVPYREDFDAAEQEAKAAGKLLFVEFTGFT